MPHNNLLSGVNGGETRTAVVAVGEGVVFRLLLCVFAVFMSEGRFLSGVAASATDGNS